VVTLDPRSLDEVLRSIVDVGAVLGTGAPARAAALVADLRARLARVEDACREARRRPTLVLEWTDPPFSAGHWIPDLVVAGGGAPVLADAGRDSARLAPEAVAAADAEVVVVAPCGYHLDAASALAGDVVAAGWLPPGAEVWAVDADAHFVRPGPRVVDGVEVVAAVLHPDRCGPPPASHAVRVA
jgi:iron complex transport system substrate-binding protein